MDAYGWAQVVAFKMIFRKTFVHDPFKWASIARPFGKFEAMGCHVNHWPTFVHQLPGRQRLFKSEIAFWPLSAVFCVDDLSTFEKSFP